MESEDHRNGDPVQDLDKVDVDVDVEGIDMDKPSDQPEDVSPTASVPHDEDETENSSSDRASGWRSESPETAVPSVGSAAVETQTVGTTTYHLSQSSDENTMGSVLSTDDISDHRVLGGAARPGSDGKGDAALSRRGPAGGGGGAALGGAHPRRSAAGGAGFVGDASAAAAKDRVRRRLTHASMMRPLPQHQSTPQWLMALRPAPAATPAKMKSQAPRSTRTAPGSARERAGPDESDYEGSGSHSISDATGKGRSMSGRVDSGDLEGGSGELCYQQSLAPGAYRMAPGCNPEPASSTFFPGLHGSTYEEDATAATNRTSSESLAATVTEQNRPASASSPPPPSLSSRYLHPLRGRLSGGPDAFLAEANLVVEEPEPALVVAKVIRRKRQVCLVLLAILGGTGLLLGLILGLAAPVVSTSRSQGGDTNAPTSSPTAAPTSELDREFRSVLPARTLLALDNETSAQHRAYEWATLEDRIPFAYHPDNATARLEHMKRRFALATLYYSTGGDATWSRGASGAEGGTNATTGQHHWLDGMLNECVWAGCFCDVGVTFPRSIDLQAQSLVGPVPPEIGLLGDGLVELVLSHNALTGTVPTELGALTRLQTLDLEGNLLSLKIPTEIGQMMNLEVLKLNYNGLDGTIPSELGKLLKLKTLMLSENLLRSRLPTELCSLNESLEVLELSRNAFTGALPSCLGSLLLLADLRLDQNLLTGTIPTEIGYLTRLSALDLSINGLTGPIAPQLGQVAKLVDLKLNMNRFSRSLPTELGRLTHLKYLHCHNNALTGPLPSELGQLLQLKELTAQGKDMDSPQHLNSTLPTELGLLQYLEVLDVSANGFTGRIPEGVGNLTSLRELRLSNNRLNGTIPSGIGQLSQLEVLHLAIATLPDESTLTGSIPTEIGLLTNLVELDLRLNNFAQSPLPTTVGRLSNLVSLLVSNSQVAGVVPTELGRLTSLQALDLFGNSLEGTIPTELGNLIELEELYLDFNNLNGTIPTELGRLSNLREVNFGSGNRGLTGAIPEELCRVKTTNGWDLEVDCDALACSCDCDCTYRDDLYY